MKTLATIGYQASTVASFLDALRDAKIDLLVDVRAVAMSRRPGFAKSALTGNLKAAGIEYLHLRHLGTPADGRAAARAGNHESMHRIFLQQLATEKAHEELATLDDLIQQGRRVCIMCFEAQPEECHRRLVANALKARGPLEVVDLFALPELE